MTDTAWVTLGGFATLIAGYVWKAFTDARNRRWDIEDRKQAAVAISQKTEAEARELRRRLDLQNESIREQHEEIKSKIDDNTKVSVEAFAEANLAIKASNDITTKFFKLAQLIQSVQPAKAPGDGTNDPATAK